LEVKSLAIVGGEEEVAWKVEGGERGYRCRDRCGGPIYMVFFAIAGKKFLKVGALGDLARLRIGG
jgi:hypothetical protein